MANYLISIPQSDTAKDVVIHDTGSKLKIEVVNMQEAGFNPSKGEVQYFVTAGNETLAFETKGYRKHRTLLILHMISWYCLYAQLIGAQIHAKSPLS